MATNGRTRLICAMEEIIANECYTQGLQNDNKYRYTVHFRENGKGYKTTNGRAPVKDDDIYSMEYRFGVHRMDIGIALDKILDFLECHAEFDGGDLLGSSASCYFSEGGVSDDEDTDNNRVW